MAKEEPNYELKTITFSNQSTCIPGRTVGDLVEPCPKCGKTLEFEIIYEQDDAGTDTMLAIDCYSCKWNHTTTSYHSDRGR